MGPSGWPVFTIRDHGLKGKTYGHNGHGLGATASYFTMPHERAACVCVCVRESFSRGLAIASKRSSIAPSEDEFRDAANDVGHSHARKRSPRESLHHDFIVPRPWTLPCVIERVVKNKGGDAPRVYVSACKFVLIASSPIRRREESVAACNARCDWLSRIFSAQLKVSNCDICLVWKGGRREDVSLLLLISTRNRGLSWWKLISCVLFFLRKNKFVWIKDMPGWNDNEICIRYYVKEYTFIIELIELIFRYSSFNNRWIIKWCQFSNEKKKMASNIETIRMMIE